MSKIGHRAVMEWAYDRDGEQFFVAVAGGEWFALPYDQWVGLGQPHKIVVGWTVGENIWALDE